MFWGVLLGIAAAGLTAGNGVCREAPGENLTGSDSSEPGSCRIEISYFLHIQPRMASNQIAVWIEDQAGNYVATVFANDYTAQGGYELRPLSLPLWREVSGWDRADPGYVDAISRATQLSGDHTVVWDCKDFKDQPVDQGRYVYRVEGNIFWENRVIWTGEITIGGTADQSQAQAEYIPERAFRKGILLEQVRAEFNPE